MQTLQVFSAVLVFLLGAITGSFCNVCILRIPNDDDIVFTPSHCTFCGKKLRFYELFPIVSYVALLGKCHTCNTKISFQYILVEIANALLWLWVYSCFGVSLETLLGCFFASTLLVLSFIDMKTCEIPPQLTYFIFVLGAANTLNNANLLLSHIAGFTILFLALFLLHFFSNGMAIGGGDVKLMAGCGLFLGFAPAILSFILASFIGSFVHILRMRFFGAGHVLALGPYISIGAFVSYLYGSKIIEMYLNLLQI